jgi:putative ABC transport system permease protein
MNIWLAEIWRSWRASFRRPGFLLLASGVLALGIGASVAVFTLIDRTLMQPLPVPHPSRLVVLGHVQPGSQGHISPHEYQYLGALEGVTSMGLMRKDSAVNITDDGVPAQVPVTYVDHGLIPTLGVQPMLGRNFNAREDRPHGPKAVLLSDGLWQQRYNSDPAVIGRRMQIDGTSTSIIGVLPASFDVAAGVADGGVVLPMALPVASGNTNQNVHVAIARLAAGADMAMVGAAADVIERNMYRGMAMGGNPNQRQITAASLASVQHREAQPLLMLFLAAAGFVLLIALVNLTNLMLLRSLSRNHDAAVRSALGAPLLRLVWPALGEGLLVGFGGALLGMLLAVIGLAVLQQFIPVEWLRGGHVGVGAAAWGLAFAIGLLGALLAAALGLWRSRSATTVDELREGGRGGMGAHSGRLGRVLVVAQVALAVTLLCAAGVIARALFNASQRPLGFASANMQTFDLSPVKASYPDAASVQALSQRLVQRLRAIPGVNGATVTTNLPTSADFFGEFNNMMHTASGQRFAAQYHAVGPGFFKLFSIPLHAGRQFTRNDVRGGEAVAIVSQNLADTQYGGRALGKLVNLEGSGSAVWPARIVGVVGDTWQTGTLQPKQPVVYVPLAQMPAPVLALFRNYSPIRFAMRGHGNAADWRAGLHQALAEVAPGQPIANLRSMHSIVRQTTADARLSLLLIGLFASLALLLAAAGLYAVMAVAVAARVRELGVRMALGATPSRVGGSVLRGGLLQIAAGLVLGVGMAQVLTRLLRALIEQLGHDAFDPLTLAGVCVVLATAGLLACLIPALRAGRVHPMRALRGE